MNKFQSKINTRAKQCMNKTRRPYRVYPELFEFNSYYKARKFFRKFYKDIC